MSTTFNFLGLPLELRQQIYSLYFKPADRIIPHEHVRCRRPTQWDDGDEFTSEDSVCLYSGGKYNFEFDIFLVCKEVKEEAQEVWRRENVFVTICTPWPQAGRGFNRVWGRLARDEEIYRQLMRKLQSLPQLPEGTPWSSWVYSGVLVGGGWWT